MKLTKNEKEVVKLLLDNGRISDVEMASHIHISTQAVGKIRKKLEETGLIEGYSCQLNYEKLGLNIFALAHTNFTNIFWKDHGEVDAIEKMKGNPHTIFSCMPSSSEISLISLYAFRDTKEMDRYFHIDKVRNHEYSELKRVYTFSLLNLLNATPKRLFRSVLENTPIVPEMMGKKD